MIPVDEATYIEQWHKTLTRNREALPTVEIVSHCYAGTLPQYAALLHYQLSSLIEFAPKRCFVDMRIVCDREDKHTAKVVDATAFLGETVFVDVEYLDRSELFRRSIGRNRRALATKADAIWMTDVDHFFGKGCLDALGDIIARGQLAEFSRVSHVWIHRTHALGDAAVEKAFRQDKKDLVVRSQKACDDYCYEAVRRMLVDENEFELRRERRPIGGIQILRQDLAHRIGYLNDSKKWQTPVDPDGGFRSCKCDVAFRKTTPPCVAIDLPNLYRIRHTRAGRDGGKKDHSKT